MRRRSLILLFRLSLLGLMCASLSGCLGYFIYGSASVGLATYPDSVSSSVSETANLSSSAAASLCSANGGVLDCINIVDGMTVESTVQIPSEIAYAGTILDPLILEVPSNVISATGTYDTGSGPQPLPISSANSFPVQPGTRITAEVGMTFLFLDLPVSVTSGLPISNPAAGPVFSYTLSFQQNFPISTTVPPLNVKPMMAGAVTILWQTYYVPLMPCVNDFASIPAITIPQASTPQDLGPTLGALISNHSVSPCNNKVYDFTQAKPPPGLVFLPLMRR